MNHTYLSLLMCFSISVLHGGNNQPMTKTPWDAERHTVSWHNNSTEITYQINWLSKTNTHDLFDIRSTERFHTTIDEKDVYSVMQCVAALKLHEKNGIHNILHDTEGRPEALAQIIKQAPHTTYLEYVTKGTPPSTKQDQQQYTAQQKEAIDTVKALLSMQQQKKHT